MKQLFPNLVHWVSQSWTGTAWDDFLQMVAEYDNESNILKARWDFNLGVWQPFRLFGFYYTELVSTNSPMLADFVLFPNPANTSVTLKSEGFSAAMIYGQQGHVVRSQSLHGQPEETIQLGNLPTGNYFLQVLGRDGKTGVKPLQIKH